jgi:hypothetical protein
MKTARISRLLPTISLLCGGTSTNAARRYAPLGTGEFGGILFVSRIVRSCCVFVQRGCLVDFDGAEGQSRQPSGLGCCSFFCSHSMPPTSGAAVAVFFVLPLFPPRNCPRSVEYGTVVEWYYVGNLDISPVLSPLVRFVLWRGGEVKLEPDGSSRIRQNEQPAASDSRVPVCGGRG